jgi:hypothetical protein
MERVIDYSLPQSFKKSLTKEACGNCGLYSNRRRSFCGTMGKLKVLKIVIFAMSGEKGSFRDSFVIFYATWLNIKTEL